MVAYVVSQGLSVAKEWREYLKEQLPHYMVPSNFVELEHFPLTPNGKIDKEKLT